MNSTRFVFAAIMLASLGSHPALEQEADSRMSFFLTSTGPGNGADLHGLTFKGRRFVESPRVGT
jgi:hypothetical protein